MKKKTAKIKAGEEKTHLYTPIAVALLIVAGLVGSVHSYVKNNPSQGSGPSMGVEAADIEDRGLPPIQKEVINAYVFGKNVYLVFPDSVTNSIAPKASQFSVLQAGILNPVEHVALESNMIILELQNEPIEKTMTLSYRDVMSSRLYTYRTGHIRSFREKIVEPVSNIEEKLSESCSERIAEAGNYADMDIDDITKIQWFLGTRGYYHGKVNGMATQLLVDAVGKFQVVQAEALAQTDFSMDSYGVWDQYTAARAREVSCQ